MTMFLLNQNHNSSLLTIIRVQTKHLKTKEPQPVMSLKHIMPLQEHPIYMNSTTFSKVGPLDVFRCNQETKTYKPHKIQHWYITNTSQAPQSHTNSTSTIRTISSTSTPNALEAEKKAKNWS